MTEQGEYWAVVELLGHVRMAGCVSEVERYGAKMGRIDIPDPEGDGFRTQYFGGGSVYRETPVSEEMGRAVAAKLHYQPAWAWMIERPALPEHEANDDPEHDDEDDDGYPF